ncbi:MAG TPA: carboxyl transferase [Candidatus Blautia intestinigallinarum]|nr:carboxyl transferase [Candidatus Blautia intestinigallinarum]
MSNTTTSLASKRIMSLLDENSFVEIGAGVKARNTDFNMAETATPSDGVITGYGVIDGNLVYVYSQDVSVLNGTIGEMHAKKIANLYDLAMKTGAPVIGLLDCVGFRLQEATDALNAFGEIYQKQAMASGVIPQITGVFGVCGGGLAVSCAMTDFTFMSTKDAQLFVNSPNAIEGNYEEKCDTSSAQYQSEQTGLVDVTGDEDQILAKIRELICMLPANNEDDASYEECTDDLNRVCENLAGCAGDTALALAQISDNHVFFQVKENYAKDMVTGFIKLNGITVGAVANRSEVYDMDGNKVEEFDGCLTSRGCRKAAQFVRFCDAFSIPVLTLTNVTGYSAGKCSERTIGESVAKLTYAFAEATVPKVNVIVGKAFGNAYVTMNSKALGADLVYAWKDAQIGMMDAKLAAKIMYNGSDMKTINEKASEYAKLQSSVESAAARGYVDTIIDPQDTRKYLISAFELLFAKREDRPAKKHETV